MRLIGGLIACRSSSADTAMLRGNPVAMSRPRISALTGPAIGKAEPIEIFSSSAVRSPISIANSARMWSTMARSSASPATRRLVLATIPANAITATSVVPPPTSTIIEPQA
jgi:hypothetical protein